MIQQNDAAGGSGSLAQSLLSIAVNGISRAVDGTLAKKYPLTSFNERQTINAEGEQKPAAAPQRDTPATETAKSLLSNPWVIAGGVSAAIALVIFVALKVR